MKIDQSYFRQSWSYFRNNINDFPKKGYLKVEKIDYQNKRSLLLLKKFKVGISWKSFTQYAEQKIIVFR